VDKSTASARVRTIAYWTFTVIIANELIAGSAWDLLRIEYVRGVFIHLGYPPYVLWILGAWKLPGGVMLLLPRFPRLKEWAYAGAFFNYTGAAASHFFVEGVSKMVVATLVFAVMTLASWALRAPARRLAGASDATSLRPIAWIVPSAVAAAMLITALLTLPKGPNPGW
jgi:uncharacterized membrane protein YphA (DoxX/SURF4 family)